MQVYSIKFYFFTVLVGYVIKYYAFESLRVMFYNNNISVSCSKNKAHHILSDNDQKLRSSLKKTHP